MSALLGLLSAVASMVRWDEPWDIELDDDPLLERPPADDAWV